MRNLTINRPHFSTLNHSDLFADFDQLFDGFFKPTRSVTRGYTAHCDVSESDTSYKLSFDLPGLSKEDVNIELKDNHLTVSGERVQQEQEGKYYRERSFGKFSRTFRVPDSAQTERIEAKFSNGVLTIDLPKAEKKQPKKITIQE